MTISFKISVLSLLKQTRELFDRHDHNPKPGLHRTLNSDGSHTIHSMCLGAALPYAYGLLVHDGDETKAHADYMANIHHAFGLDRREFPIHHAAEAITQTPVFMELTNDNVSCRETPRDVPISKCIFFNETTDGAGVMAVLDQAIQALETEASN